MEHDEMSASQTSMIRASAVSLLGVTCLFIAGFGGIRHPLMTVLALLMGMSWSFGYITLAIGHLNILSVSFSVILIGLGIDFGIHFVARYLQRRNSVHGCNSTQTATGENDRTACRSEFRDDCLSLGCNTAAAERRTRPTGRLCSVRGARRALALSGELRRDS